MNKSRRVAPGPWLITWLLIAAACTSLGVWGRTSSPLSFAEGALTPVSTTVPHREYLTRPIKDVQLGTWLLAMNPQGAESDDWEVDEPKHWRKLVLRLLESGGGTIDLELLRDVAWIEQYGARAGGTIALDLEELGAVGQAEVRAVLPCPEIAARPSPIHHLVTARFKHTAHNVIDVRLEGEQHPIGVTANHPFFSQDRDAFIEASQLQLGESLLDPDGHTVHVASVSQKLRTAEVYNLEIAGEHVYFVSRQGVLVHNTCAASVATDLLGRTKKVVANVTMGTLGTGTKAVRTSAIRAGDDAGHIIAKRLGGDGTLIFSQNRSINRGAFRSFERQVYDKVLELGQVQATVAFRYNGTSKRVSRIIYTVRDIDGNLILKQAFGN